MISTRCRANKARGSSKREGGESRKRKWGAVESENEIQRRGCGEHLNRVLAGKRKQFGQN